MEIRHVRIMTLYVDPDEAATLEGCPGPGWYYKLPGAPAVGPFETEGEMRETAMLDLIVSDGNAVALHDDAETVEAMMQASLRERQN